MVYHMTYPSKKFNGQNFIELYIPARTAIVLKEVKKEDVKPAKVKKETKPRTKKQIKTEEVVDKEPALKAEKEVKEKKVSKKTTTSAKKDRRIKN